MKKTSRSVAIMRTRALNKRSRTWGEKEGASVADFIGVPADSWEMRALQDFVTYAFRKGYEACRRASARQGTGDV